jgi:hypothetical protein
MNACKPRIRIWLVSLARDYQHKAPKDWPTRFLTKHPDVVIRKQARTEKAPPSFVEVIATEESIRDLKNLLQPIATFHELEPDYSLPPSN